MVGSERIDRFAEPGLDTADVPGGIVELQGRAGNGDRFGDRADAPGGVVGVEVLDLVPGPADSTARTAFPSGLCRAFLSGAGPSLAAFVPSAQDPLALAADCVAALRQNGVAAVAQVTSIRWRAFNAKLFDGGWQQR